MSSDALIWSKDQGIYMSTGNKPVMSEEFWAWFDAVRRDRDLSDSGMAKLAKPPLANTVISKARNNERPIGAEALTRLADGLGLPRLLLLRLGGWIPKDEAKEWVNWEASIYWNELSEDKRDELLVLMKAMVANERRQQGDKSEG
jgi:hypothetical protein